MAISDHRIVGCNDRTVTYRYTPSGTRRAEVRTVTGEEFLRGLPALIAVARRWLVALGHSRTGGF